MTIVTLANYNSSPLPPLASTHVFTRQCPNMRTCWPGLSTPFNPLVTPRDLALRRFAFLLSNILQIPYLYLYASHLTTSPSAIPWTIATILFFFWRAWNLHLIVSMEGKRVVFERAFGRRWFDGALWGAVAGYAGLLGCWWWLALGWRGVETMWLVVDLFVLAMAWICTWEGERLVVVWSDAV